MRARLVFFTLLALFGLLSQSPAQDELPIPEDEQIRESLETPAEPTIREGEGLPAAEQEAAPLPEGAVNPNPLSSLDLESLTATLSAPLFTPSRTGPVVEVPVEAVVEAPPPAPEVATEEPPPGLQLVGIVLTDAAKTALLKDPSSNEIHRLNSGEKFQGWSLTIVDARSVEFRSGDRVEGLKMFESFPTPVNYGMPLDQTIPEGLLPMDDPSMMQQPPPPDQQLDGVSLEGMSQQGFPSQEVPPEGMSQQGFPLQEVPPEGMSQQGFPSHEVPPEDIAPEAGGRAVAPQNFDPQTGELLIPEEGPLQVDGDPNAQQ